MNNPYNLENPNKGYLLKKDKENFSNIGDIEDIETCTCKRDKSYKCPHAGCQAKWNEDENAFVCPCHGSKFNEEGVVLRGPAKKNLNCKN